MGSTFLWWYENPLICFELCAPRKDLAASWFNLQRVCLRLNGADDEDEKLSRHVGISLIGAHCVIWNDNAWKTSIKFAFNYWSWKLRDKYKLLTKQKSTQNLHKEGERTLTKMELKREWTQLCKLHGISHEMAAKITSSKC